MIDSNRAEGVLLGLACGDALGRPVEFMSEASIQRQYGRLDEMVGGGTHNQPPGTISDDTELALCIARSLVTYGGFEGADVARRFLKWYRGGPFDVGSLTACALSRMRKGHPWTVAGQECWEERPEGQNAGNGSVMRCAPYALAYSDDLDALGTISRASSRITHYDPRCTYGCAILNLTIAHALKGTASPLAEALDAVRDEAPSELVDSLESIPDEAPALLPTPYVVTTLQVALYDALTADNAKEAIV